MRGHGWFTAEEDDRVRHEVVERHRHAAGHPLLPEGLQAAGSHPPGLMGLGHSGHQDRERRLVGRQVAAGIAAGHDLRALHAPPDHHHPGPRGLHHEGLHLVAAGLRLCREPAGGAPRFQHLQPEIHLPRGRRAGPRLAIVAVEPPGGGEEDAPRARRHGGEGGEGEALAVNGQPPPADAGDGGGLAGGPRIDFGRDRRQQRRARPGEPRPFPQPLEIIDQLEARAQHRLAGDEHVEVSRHAAEPRVGRADQRTPGPRVAGPHPSALLGELLEVGLRQAGAEVPHQHAVPVAEHRQRLGIADVDVGDRRRWADHPHSRPPRLDELLGRCWLRKPHAVETQRRQHRQWFAAPIDRPREEGEAVDIEHAPRQARGGIDLDRGGGGRGDHQWVDDRRCGRGQLRGRQHAREVQVVDRDLHAAGQWWRVEHEVRGPRSIGLAGAMLEPQRR